MNACVINQDHDQFTQKYYVKKFIQEISIQEDVKSRVL